MLKLAEFDMNSFEEQSMLRSSIMVRLVGGESLGFLSESFKDESSCWWKNLHGDEDAVEEGDVVELCDGIKPLLLFVLA